MSRDGIEDVGHLIGQAGPAVSLYQAQRQAVSVGKGKPRKCLAENRRRT